LTWSEPLIDVPVGASTFIGAIDPKNPDTVYVRVKVPTNTIGQLHMTTDAGATWTQIWTGQGDVAGFALSPDGATVAVGGPDSGINVASTSDFVFSRPNPLGPSCLTWVGGKLFACAKEATDLFSIGYSADKGVSFVPLLNFPDITPRACGAMTSAAVCASSWEMIAPTIGIDAGAPDASMPMMQPPPKIDAAGGWNCALARLREPHRAWSWGAFVAFASLWALRRARVRVPSSNYTSPKR
jgi:hypothetical protein